MSHQWSLFDNSSLPELGKLYQDLESYIICMSLHPSPEDKCINQRQLITYFGKGSPKNENVRNNRIMKKSSPVT